MHGQHLLSYASSTVGDLKPQFPQGDVTRPCNIPRAQPVQPRALACTQRTRPPRCCIRFREARVPGVLHGPRNRVGCHCRCASGVRDIAGEGRSTEGAVHIWNRQVRLLFCLGSFFSLRLHANFALAVPNRSSAWCALAQRHQLLSCTPQRTSHDCVFGKAELPW